MDTNNFTSRYLNSKDLKTYVLSKTCTQIFIAAEWCDQPKYISVEGGTDKQNIIYSYRKYYSAIKRNEVSINATT